MLNEDVYFETTQKIIDSCITVHKQMGPGLLESVYECCLIDEMGKRNLKCESQVKLPVLYKGKQLNKDFFIDILVEDAIILELKSIEIVLPVHEVQLLTYLKLSNKKLGLLINFNVPLLKEGIKRRINGYL